MKRPSLMVLAGIVLLPLAGAAQEPAWSGIRPLCPVCDSLAAREAARPGGHGIFGVAAGGPHPSSLRQWLMETARAAEGMDDGIFIAPQVDGWPTPDTQRRHTLGDAIKIPVDEYLEKYRPGTNEPAEPDSVRPHGTLAKPRAEEGPVKAPEPTGLGEFLYAPAQQEPDERLDVRNTRVRMRPLPPADDDAWWQALDVADGRVYRRLHLGGTTPASGYRPWMRQGSPLRDTIGWPRMVWMDEGAGNFAHPPAFVAVPAKESAGRASNYLWDVFLNGDERAPHAHAPEGIVWAEEQDGPGRTALAHAPSHAVLDGPGLPHPVVPALPLYGCGLAESRAGHPYQHRGKRLRRTSAGGRVECSTCPPTGGTTDDMRC